MALPTPAYAGVTTEIMAVGPNAIPDLSSLQKLNRTCHAARRKIQGQAVTMTAEQRQLAINAKATLTSWIERSRATPDILSEDWIGASRKAWLFGYTLDLQACLDQLLPTLEQTRIAKIDVGTPKADTAPVMTKE